MEDDNYLSQLLRFVLDNTRPRLVNDDSKCAGRTAVEAELGGRDAPGM